MYQSLVLVEEPWASELVRMITPYLISLKRVSDEFNGLRDKVAAMNAQLKLRDDVISLLDGPVFPERSKRGRPTTSLNKKEEKLE